MSLLNTKARTGGHGWAIGRLTGRLALAARSLAAGLHRSQHGTISILSVFAVLLLTMLLGMVMNSGRQVDGKIRMQNAADAVAYSGAVVIARGLNTLAFTNHLLSDVLALTAFMREARDRNAEQYVPSILAAWNQVAPLFARSGFPKFERLGAAIPLKTPLEQELVRAYSQWGAAASQQILPLLEYILGQEGAPQSQLIPEFQRAVVQAYPDIAQLAAMEVAQRNGRPEYGRGTMLGALWRGSPDPLEALPVGGAGEMGLPSLPVVDPVAEAAWGDSRYLDIARQQRKRLAETYLRHWNDEALVMFDREAKMCQFGALWRGFTCAYLRDLLEKEFPRSNLPHVLRWEVPDPQYFDPFWDQLPQIKEHLQRHFTYVGVVYWRRLPEIFPRVFRNPLEGDAMAFAEARVFIPHPRLEYQRVDPSGGPSDIPLGGMPGDFPTLPPDEPLTPGDGPARWIVGRQHVPTEWTLINQNWTAQLVPATVPNLAAILQTPPPVAGWPGYDLRLPDLGGLSTDQIIQISIH